MTRAKQAASRMPAEWEPHEATWLAWPHEPEDWPGKLAPIPWVYGEIIRHLTVGETVRLLVTAALEKEARKLLSRVGVDLGRVDFVRAATDRVWTRDSCPQILVGPRGRAACGFRFNGWAKYPNHKRDMKLPEVVAQHLGLPLTLPERQTGARMVLEGGAIDVNGRGSLLTTEECLLSKVQERNPGLSRADYEQAFAEQLGAPHTIWLGQGIDGDDTHGHVDDLARFVEGRTVVIASEKDPRDENFKRLKDNLKRLQRAKDQDGRALSVVELPMPRPVVLGGQRLPASYANFYIGNEAVLVPTFNDPADREALGILARLFPERRVVGIHAVDLVWGLGTLHCLSQQEPRG